MKIPLKGRIYFHIICNLSSFVFSCVHKFNILYDYKKFISLSYILCTNTSITIGFYTMKRNTITIRYNYWNKIINLLFQIKKKKFVKLLPINELSELIHIWIKRWCDAFSYWYTIITYLNCMNKKKKNKIKLRNTLCQWLYLRINFH